MSNRSEYRIWNGIVDRCLNTNAPFYSIYGGSGVKIHPAWRHSFVKFLKYVGPRPSPKHSIDRFPDPAGNYEPGNVRWATQSQQTRNTRTTRRHTAFGKTLCLAEWAEKSGLNVNTLSWRLNHEKEPIEKALRPLERPRKYKAFGKSKSISEWSKETGLSWATINGRLKLGWSVEDSVATNHIGSRHPKTKQ